jgi:hypothetical protein
MMTPQEIIDEIFKLPPSEQEKIAETVLKNREKSEAKMPRMTEEEFIQYLFEKGLITHIPKGMTDEDDDFEPIEIEGEPLSETIIRERR